MVKEHGFKLESKGQLELVIVRCPTGHRLQGIKTDALMVGQTIACPTCEKQWTIVAPLTNRFEASL